MSYGMRITDRQFREPLDIDGARLDVGDRVQSTDLLQNGEPVLGTVVDMGRENIIHVEFDDAEGSSHFAAFLVRKVKP